MQQTFLCFFGNLQSGLVEFPAELFEKMIRQQQHVVPALSQGRNRHRHGGNPEIQIVTKQSFLHLLLQIAVCGHYDANIHVNRLRSAHAFESSFFQHAQQLRLNRQWQLSNLIQKQGTPVRQVHFAHFARTRSRERALLVSEQLVLHQPFRNRRAIQRHERLFAPRRQMMNRERKQFFPRAAFPQQQARRIGCRHFLDLLTHFLNGSVLSHNARKPIPRRVFRPQQQILALELLLFRRSLH